MSDEALSDPELPGFDQAARYQITAHAVSLAMQNAVAQQQHAYTLLNAVTTAAAQAVLEGKIEEAEVAAKLARELLDPDHLVETLTRLHELIDRVEKAPEAQVKTRGEKK